jgi:toxin ParE1/3/4
VTVRPLVLRELAQQDIDEAIAYYQAESGEPLALRFIDALQEAFRRLGTHPGIGSLRYAYELNLEGLRAWPLRRFPFVVFYREQPDHIDVWRVLQAQRGIPAWMQDPETPPDAP